MDRRIEFGNHIKQIRVNKGYSLRDVQRDSGISNAYISQIENASNKSMPKPNTIKKLAHGLHVPVSDLLSYAGFSKENIEHPEDYTNGHFDIAKAIKNKHYMTWQGKPLTDLDKKMLIKMFGSGDSKHE